MDQEDELFKVRQSLGQQTMGITQEQFWDFVAERQSNGPCESCGSANWIFPHDDNMPAILGAANVRNATTANWFYWIVCGHCANTRMIAAGQVWDYYYGPNKRVAE